MRSIRDVLAAVESHPLHRYIGVETLHAEQGHSSFEIIVGSNTVNTYGAFHGGVVYTLCDMACYVALMSELGEGEDAVTHDIHVSLLRATKIGDRIRFQGKVIKRGRNLGFMEAEAYLGEQLIARAAVTKSILQPKPPTSTLSE
jgi:uncharacterized protein (TIGR00369 family)